MPSDPIRIRDGPVVTGNPARREGEGTKGGRRLTAAPNNCPLGEPCRPTNRLTRGQFVAGPDPNYLKTSWGWGMFADILPPTPESLRTA
ncbi:hypothetical protein GWI33_006522 [Rhynchophorus ferrugineus]|uniref:Uncharacterized protein n=1 Tax=Rhynchophorus ferrugineus TaxID=354439 RepID=A0A834MFE8_RHYFE|nr:hypothetical protein GWI33_006522 [Rhynchophorus ferrugineus]